MRFSIRFETDGPHATCGKTVASDSSAEVRNGVAVSPSTRAPARAPDSRGSAASSRR